MTSIHKIILEVSERDRKREWVENNNPEGNWMFYWNGIEIYGDCSVLEQR